MGQVRHLLGDRDALVAARDLLVDVWGFEASADHLRKLADIMARNDDQKGSAELKAALDRSRRDLPSYDKLQLLVSLVKHMAETGKSAEAVRLAERLYRLASDGMETSRLREVLKGVRFSRDTELISRAIASVDATIRAASNPETLTNHVGLLAELAWLRLTVGDRESAVEVFGHFRDAIRRELNRPFPGFGYVDDTILLFEALEDVEGLRQFCLVLLPEFRGHTARIGLRAAATFYKLGDTTTARSLANGMLDLLPQLRESYGVSTCLNACVEYSRLMRDLGEPGRAREGGQKASELLRGAEDPSVFEEYDDQVAGLLAACGDWLGIYDVLARAQKIEKPSHRSDVMRKMAAALSPFPEMHSLVCFLVAGLPADLHSLDTARMVRCHIALGEVEKARSVMRSALVRVARQEENDVLWFIDSCQEELRTFDPDAYWSLPELLLQDNRWLRIASRGTAEGK